MSSSLSERAKKFSRRHYDNILNSSEKDIYREHKIEVLLTVYWYYIKIDVNGSQYL